MLSWRSFGLRCAYIISFEWASYIDPPSTLVSFWDDLQHCIDKIKNRDFTKITLTGDLKADPSTNNDKKLIDICASNCLSMHINQPTKITETTSSCLDQVIANIPNFVRSTNTSAPLANCDHCTVSANLLFR